MTSESLNDSSALILIAAMAVVIFGCRAFVFLFPHKEAGKPNRFLSFIEKAAPPVAMCVLAVNYIAARIKTSILPAMSLETLMVSLLPVIAASVCTALLHIWKRNPLMSIFAGLVVYMALDRAL